MATSKILLSLDVGERRIGVARADSSVPIAVPLTTVSVDGTEVDAITRIVRTEGAEQLVIGYPRNQSGEATAQTAYVEAFASRLEALAPIVFQDESLTSVTAEQRLQSQKKAYTKADIDAYAAAIILQDYMEIHYAA